MVIKELVDRERWDHNNCVIIDPIYQAKRRAETPEINAHNMSLDRIEQAVSERIGELETALENLMDAYQYNVCYDRNYEKARKVLKKEEG